MEKCNLFAEKTDYVVHVICPGGFELEEHKTDSVAKVEYPTTQTKLRSFLIVCNVSMQFSEFRPLEA